MDVNLLLLREPLSGADVDQLPSIAGAWIVGGIFQKGV
jgi:hypothetical protein